MAVCHGQASYVPRGTQDCDAVAVVREHLPAFLERLEQSGGSLPAFVQRKLEAFVTCGDFEHGFLVAACRRCGDTLRVPFSCKSRGVCPSCMGRRMCETAALLADHRLPAVPYRQWVLSFEGALATFAAAVAGVCGFAVATEPSLDLPFQVVFVGLVVANLVTAILKGHALFTPEDAYLKRALERVRAPMVSSGTSRASDPTPPRALL